MGESKFGVYFNFSSGTFVNLTVNNLFFLILFSEWKITTITFYCVWIYQQNIVGGYDMKYILYLYQVCTYQWGRGGYALS